MFQVALGQPSRKLEEIYNTSFKQITNWVHRFEQEGVDGLRDKPRSGRTPKLNQELLKEIAVVLSNDSPTKYKYNTATWTVQLLIDWIKTTYNIEFKNAQIYNILKSLGFSYQKGRGVFSEAHAERQDSFKESLRKLIEEHPDAVLLYEDECSLSNTVLL